jgi:aspartyl/asparaginyl-tRNA synthetase
MKLLSFFRGNKKSYNELLIENNILKEQIKHMEDNFNLKLEIKDNEIKHLNDKITNFVSHSIKDIKKESNNSLESNDYSKLSRIESKIYKLHLNNQCTNYLDLEKVTSYKQNYLRNIISRIRKKGFKFEWYY